MPETFRQGTELQTVQICDFDPTIGDGIPNGTSFLFLIRTDLPSLYYYEGPADTDWILLASGTPSEFLLPRTPEQTVTANAIPFTITQMNAAASTPTVNLPLAADYPNGAWVGVIAFGAGGFEIVRTGGDTINKTLEILEIADIPAYAWAFLIGDGVSDWSVLSFGHM